MFGTLWMVVGVNIINHLHGMSATHPMYVLYSIFIMYYMHFLTSFLSLPHDIVAITSGEKKYHRKSPSSPIEGDLTDVNYCSYATSDPIVVDPPMASPMISLEEPNLFPTLDDLQLLGDP